MQPAPRGVVRGLGRLEEKKRGGGGIKKRIDKSGDFEKKGGRFGEK